MVLGDLTPSARSSHGLAALGQKLYLFGGYDGSGECFADVSLFSLARLTRCLHCAAGVLGDFYSWNPSTRAWTDMHQAGNAADSCRAESLNDFTCLLWSPCYLFCQTGSVGRRVQFPSRYNNNEAMAWVIGLQNAHRVTLHFTYFDTEGYWDFVTVYSCTDQTCMYPVQLGSFSGTSMPANVTSSTGFMRIEWTSDYSVTYTGWTAEWTTGSDQAVRISSQGPGSQDGAYLAAGIRGHRRQATAVGARAVSTNTALTKPPGRKDHGFAACQERLYTFGGIGAAGKSPFYLLCSDLVSCIRSG